MNFEPVINARFKRFREQHDLINVRDGTAFEHFVNYNILYAHNPEPFLGNSDFLQFCSVGGSNDLAIDGIGIKLNGAFVRNEEEVDAVLERSRKATVEFIFIQSKYKEKFEMGEFNNFIAGVRDFLSDTHLQPMNDFIKRLIKIKEYILSDEISSDWESNPSVRLYYVTMGRNQGLPHIEALQERFKQDIHSMNIYEDVYVQLIDSKALKIICDNNTNRYSATIEVIDSMALTPVENVDNSCMVLCTASEIYKLMETPDGVLRKSLFNDNVRDFQGATSINEDIEGTIIKEPQKFVLLNNGITIVCDEYKTNNRKITLVNPQIVNGCQTSHMIYFSMKKGCDISLVPVSMKIISTTNDHITGQIVRGTNKQNIVYDEAFETTRDFHKELEEFFPSISRETLLYYERRSKQYHLSPIIKQHQKISFRSLIQGFIAMFLNQPDVASRHESRLIKDFRNKIFLDEHSKLPYYTTALALYFVEKFIRESPELVKDNKTLKYHLLMVIRECINSKLPNLRNDKEIDAYCLMVIERLNNDFEGLLHTAIAIINKSKDIWTQQMGKSIHGIKDVADFTKLLVEQTSNRSLDPVRETGIVKRVLRDRNNNNYGFISRLPNNIFFHSKSSGTIDFTKLEGKLVSYVIEPNPFRKNEDIAVDVRCEEV
ncbi:AIPR family protein [Paenibacillus sp. strain BS8-2]